MSNQQLAEPLYITKYIKRISMGNGDMIRRKPDKSLSYSQSRWSSGCLG